MLEVDYKGIRRRVFNLVLAVKELEKEHKGSESFSPEKEGEINALMWDIQVKMKEAKKNSSPKEVEKLEKFEDTLSALLDRDKIKFSEIYVLPKLL